MFQISASVPPRCPKVLSQAEEAPGEDLWQEPGEDLGEDLGEEVPDEMGE